MPQYHNRFAIIRRYGFYVNCVKNTKACIADWFKKNINLATEEATGTHGYTVTPVSSYDQVSKAPIYQA